MFSLRAVIDLADINAGHHVGRKRVHLFIYLLALYQVLAIHAGSLVAVCET